MGRNAEINPGRRGPLAAFKQWRGERAARPVKEKDAYWQVPQTEYVDRSAPLPDDGGAWMRRVMQIPTEKLVAGLDGPPDSKRDAEIIAGAEKLLKDIK